MEYVAWHVSHATHQERVLREGLLCRETYWTGNIHAWNDPQVAHDDWMACRDEFVVYRVTLDEPWTPDPEYLYPHTDPQDPHYGKSVHSNGVDIPPERITLVTNWPTELRRT